MNPLNRLEFLAFVAISALFFAFVVSLYAIISGVKKKQLATVIIGVCLFASVLIIGKHVSYAMGVIEYDTLQQMMCEPQKYSIPFRLM